MADVTKLEDVPIRLLGVSGSPRDGSNSEAILDVALESASATGLVEISKYTFHHKHILPCLHCGACAKTKRCVQKDDFGELFELWMETDAVIYSTPVYHMGVTGQLKCAIDRLGHVFFSVSGRVLPRIMKVGAVIAQGNCRHGGQESAMLYVIQHLLTMNCIPIPGDTPDSYIGAGGMVANLRKGGIAEDEIGMLAARTTGRRVAEVAKILKVGMSTLRDQLPADYKWQYLLEK